MAKVQVHKLVVMVIDFDRLGAAGVAEVLAHTRYPNDCIGPHVMEISTREVDWSDDHPLNIWATQSEAWEALFDHGDK